MRAVRIIEGLNALVDAKVILGFTRMTGPDSDVPNRWLVHTRVGQHYFTDGEVEAFIAGAAAARS